MRKTFFALVLLAVAFNFAFFAMGSAPAFAQSAISAETSAAGAESEDYRLGPSDRLTISVFGEDEFSREYVVTPSGSISLPLIGEVKAQGLTSEQLRNQIQSRLGAGFINNPSVTLVITGFRNFYIFGEVNKPGEYAYKSGLTIIQAVAQAEGFTYRAARRYVFLRRDGDAAEAKVALTPTLKVRPGDTIRLGERYF
jgi:protein involved in polysaccharide export with SLBB domain